MIFRTSSKKALTELTDSGVSVVSDTPPIGPVKDNRVLAWLMETDKGGKNVSHTHSEMSLKHRSHRTSSATSPIASRHRKGNFAVLYNLNMKYLNGHIIFLCN